MKKTNLLFASVCAATALVPFHAAFADAPVGAAGSINVSYGNFSADGGSASVWGGGGSVAFGLGQSFAAQIDGNYNTWTSQGCGSCLNTWGIGGSLFMAQDWGRFGATVTYSGITVSGSSADTTTYGVFGEWYASDIFTLAAKFGGASITSGFGCGGEGNSTCTGTGYYVGGGATAYVMPDLALSAGVDFIGDSGGGQVAISVNAEWLVSEQVPISIGGGYTNLSYTGDSSGAPSFSEWMVTVKLYFNGDNSMTLRDRQRNGASTWATTPPKLVEE